MENFIVSARKYRPATFQSVVGQSALTTTLRNAIISNKLAHAYLFCGPRGVGKTTCARIFAKTINCQNLTAEAEACNQCESCLSFNEQRSYNIHELDAASNNGVDDIRSIIDQVRIPPQIGKYSVYIIDEVHMLSPGAFNAFLKTLEEPPAHAIFILATTEKHKIIPTILSRCQIYDFNRITISDTVSHLKYVAEQEGVTVDEKALNIIAQKSDGGMRDALSIFDQLVSFCGSTIDYQGVIDNLNVLDYEYYFRLLTAMLSNNITEALLIFNEVLNKGFDGHHFVGGLSAHLRDLLVSKDPQTIPLMEVGAGLGKLYEEQARQCPVDFLIQALRINNECDLNYRISNNKRLLVELTLIRLCQLTDEKKKGLSPTDTLPPLKKIEVSAETTAPAAVDTAQAVGKVATQPSAKISAQPEANGTAQPLVKAATQPKVVAETDEPLKFTANKANGNTSRRSISITTRSKQYANTAEPTEVKESTSTLNEPYTQKSLEKAWRKYTAEIPEIVSLVSYIQNTVPLEIADHTYELTFSNVFQENEFKKYTRELTAFIHNELRNTNINFTTRLVENTEKYKSSNPEDIYKRMAEENPALNILRSKLRLEID